MKNRSLITAFAPLELNRFLAPLALATLFFMMVLILDGILVESSPDPYLILYGFAGIFYVLIYTILIARSTFFRKRYSWFNAIASGIGLGLLTYILPAHLHEMFHVLIVFGAIATATTSGRSYTYINLLLSAIVSLPNHIRAITSSQSTLEYLSPFIMSIIAAELYLRLK